MTDDPLIPVPRSVVEAALALVTGHYERVSEQDRLAAAVVLRQALAAPVAVPAWEWVACADRMPGRQHRWLLAVQERRWLPALWDGRSFIVHGTPAADVTHWNDVPPLPPPPGT